MHVEVTPADGVPDRLAIEADVVPGPAAGRLPDRGRPPGADERGVDVRRDLDPIRLDTPERPYHPDQDDPWHLYSLITRGELRVGRRARYPAEFHDVGQPGRGRLGPRVRPTSTRPSTWQVDEERRTVRLRIPWSMLGLADPSSRTALGEGVPAERVTIDGIDLPLDADGEHRTGRVHLAGVELHDVPAAAEGRDRTCVEQAYRDLAP